MIEWTPVLVLPNLDIRRPIECQYAAIVSPSDSRVEQIKKERPTLDTFLSAFSGQFGKQYQPSLFILRDDAPETYRTAEAVTAFRDLLSLSVIPIARARRLYSGHGETFAYSTAFQFYPWMLDKNYEHLIMTNPASLSTHLLSKFQRQSFPEQSQASLDKKHVDAPLANALLERWMVRFSNSSPEWRDRALFRSLNMANDAARLPAVVAATFHDVGRTLVLWVSALEILTHPGVGKSNFNKVSKFIENIKWINKELSEEKFETKIGNKISNRILSIRVLRKIYDLRDDYIHGNGVDPSELVIKDDKAIIDFAACIYRLTLTEFLDLYFNAPRPQEEDPDAVAKFIARRMAFREPQRLFESAVLVAA